ncbi:YojF family protein [Litchfieldia alkalitelluris]|uniref:YojF family protein n=1 Tax=Litchfieldia alkalitelluris TaxID=304268 RepID=UPI0009987835|nr:YojF family protein [Litchfieldia alkalitelluris]
MKTITVEDVQKKLNELVNTELYLHLETTNGAYAAHNDATKMNVGAYIRNALISFSLGKITGAGPYRVGLKTSLGWIYAEGLTDYHIDEHDRLLLAGHDTEGRLAVAFQLSKNPF